MPAHVQRCLIIAIRVLKCAALFHHEYFCPQLQDSVEKLRRQAAKFQAAPLHVLHNTDSQSAQRQKRNANITPGFGLQ
jgi:hypothetical protein